MLTAPLDLLLTQREYASIRRRSAARIARAHGGAAGARLMAVSAPRWRYGTASAGSSLTAMVAAPKAISSPRCNGSDCSARAMDAHVGLIPRKSDGGAR